MTWRINKQRIFEQTRVVVCHKYRSVLETVEHQDIEWKWWKSRRRVDLVDPTSLVNLGREDCADTGILKAWWASRRLEVAWSLPFREVSAKPF